MEDVPKVGDPVSAHSALRLGVSNFGKKSRSKRGPFGLLTRPGPQPRPASTAAQGVSKQHC
eukprot:13758112-Alexandrium_andersonii.AAC.1